MTSPRPRFLDQPYEWTRTPRTGDSRVNYASPVTIPTARRWGLVDLVYAIALVLCSAAIGAMLAWGM